MMIKRIFYLAILYSFFQSLLKNSGYPMERIKLHIKASIKFWKEDFLFNLSPPYRVESGVFQGLIYPRLVSYGSSLIPKLLGIYESELENELNNITTNNYSYVFNIGCGEGYYICGFSKFMKSEFVAVDSEIDAVNLSKNLALHNKCNKNIDFIYSSTFSFKGYEEILSKRNLIVCDAEGFELKLFPEHPINYFENSDLIIELHDFIDPRISSVLFLYFEKSHHIITIKSSTPESKLKNFTLRSIKKYPQVIKKILIDEERPGPMSWLVCYSKKYYDT